MSNLHGYNQTNVKIHNRYLVYNVIRLNGPILRASVARQTNLTRTTITNIINEFIKLGLVTCSTRGLLQINPEAFNICSIHLQGSSAKVTVMTAGMDFVESTIVPLTGTPHASLARIAGVVNSYKENYSFVVMGVAVSGVIDATKAMIKHSVTLKWENICLKTNLQQLVDLPMVVERNANAPLVADVWQGAATGKRNIVYVNYGNGVGCGIMLNGELVANPGFASGELGHTTVNPFGPFCHCGNQGCLEALVAIPALLQQCKTISTSFDDISGEEIGPLFQRLYKEIDQGNELCHSLLISTAQYIGIALANISTLIGPEIIVLGNGFLSTGDRFITMITDEVEKRVLRSSRGSVKIVLTEIKTDAITMGISALAIRHVFNLYSSHA